MKQPRHIKDLQPDKRNARRHNPRTPALSRFVAQSMLEFTWRHATIQHAATVDLPHVTYYALGIEPRRRR